MQRLIEKLKLYESELFVMEALSDENLKIEAIEAAGSLATPNLLNQLSVLLAYLS